MNLRVAQALLILTISSTGAAFAQETNSVVDSKGLLRCASLTNSIDRLTCYDELAKKAGPISETESKVSGEWHIQTNTSKFDDSKSVYLTVRAKEPITGWPGKSHTPSFMIRCTERKTDAYINFGMSPHVEYGLYGDATLQFRIDKQSPFKIISSKSTDGEALFLPDPISFAKRLFRANQLLVRFVPFNSSPQETWFNVAGLDKAIQPIMETCKWPK